MPYLLHNTIEYNIYQVIFAYQEDGTVWVTHVSWLAPRYKENKLELYVN